MSRQNVVTPSDELAGLEDPASVFKNPGQLTFLRTFIDFVRNFMGDVVRVNRTNLSFLMQSPAGKIYKITINDAGVLTSEYIRG